MLSVLTLDSFVPVNIDACKIERKWSMAIGTRVTLCKVPVFEASHSLAPASISGSNKVDSVYPCQFAVQFLLTVKCDYTNRSVALTSRVASISFRLWNTLAAILG